MSDAHLRAGDKSPQTEPAPRPGGPPTRVRPSGLVVLLPWDRTRAWAPMLGDVLTQLSGLPAQLIRPSPSLTAHRPLPLESVEHQLFGVSQPHHSGWVAVDDAPASLELPWRDSLVVNATGCDPLRLPAAIREAVVLSPTFDGHFAIEDMRGRLIDGEPPHLGIIVTEGETSGLLHTARLAVPERDATPRALDAILGRTIALLRDAADHLIRGRPLPEPIPPPQAGPVPSRTTYCANRLLRAALPKLARKLGRPLFGEEWCIGYRRQLNDGEPTSLSLAPSSFCIVEAPPGRYYADPFILTHGGVTAVFFEDYEIAGQKGRISFVVIEDDGSHGAPVEALSRPYHLSYPFLLSHAGAALMVPETSTNRTIELYEAQAFPRQWRLRSVLLENIEASDTTLHFDESTGTWWMFTAVTEFGGSSHDTLSIFFSERLEGPWCPHPSNPVKYSPASRPAGPLLSSQGRLFRPAQDCTVGYGGGLVWWEIDQLGPDAFHERAVAKQGLPGRFSGLHTYGRAGGLEVADFKRNRWRRR